MGNQSTGGVNSSIEFELNGFISQIELESIISYGMSAGADLVEVFLEKTDSISCLAEQESISSVNPSFSRGAGIRVFKGIKDGFYSTNVISFSGLKTALDYALGMLGLKSSSSIQPTSFEGLQCLKDYSLDKIKDLNRLPNLEDVSDKILKGTDLLNKYGNHLTTRKGSYSRVKQEVIIAASDGTHVKDIRLHQSMGLSVLASHKEHRSSIGRRYGSSESPDALKDWDIAQSAESICESVKAMLHADYVTAGTKPVILANRFGGVIFHEACGHLLETTQIERGTSPFSDKLNSKIANEAVTAIDEGFTDQAFGSLSVDDEGMEPQKTLLIENGVLKNFLSDRGGQIRTGHKRTGSGRRQSHTFAAASRMRNTFIAAGNYEPKELIETVDDGIYCKSMGGGSVGATGQFNFSVEEGYLIKNGKLTTPVKGATLIGEAKEILPKISMCANDLELAAGYCGSVSGSVNVTVGQPHIKVDSITIGGR